MVTAAGKRNHFVLGLDRSRDDLASCQDALTDGVELRVDVGRIAYRTFVNKRLVRRLRRSRLLEPAYREGKVRTALHMLPDLLAEHAKVPVGIDGEILALRPPVACECRAPAGARRRP
ncbi:hypothetical protein [Actinomadura nitritigenes]|uniref:hypothetical protein n=1 Tax=Actinomadura nitritigenes TaxID=134602 RepID=UPI003D9458C0